MTPKPQPFLKILNPFKKAGTAFTSHKIAEILALDIFALSGTLSLDHCSTSQNGGKL